MSVNAILYEREQEPEFFARKCRRCKQPTTRCECELERDEPSHVCDEFCQCCEERPGL